MEKKRNIVVVDDDQTNAQLLEEFLKENDFEVSLAYTAKEGLQKIFDLQPDMVILDLFLPDRMGSDVCSELRSQNATRNIPIIICTAHSITHTQKMKGFCAGVDDYLVRPFELPELLARINAILRRTNMKPNIEVLEGIDALFKKKTVASPISAPPEVPAIPKIIFSTPAAPNKSDPPAFFLRLWEVLNHPFRVFEHIKESSDFLISLVLVLGTPAIASFAKLAQRSGGFDAWIGVFSLGLVIHLIMWFGTAGLLHLVVPFQGVNLTLKRALILAGFGWAPRLLGTILAALYGLAAVTTGWVGEAGNFSSGLDLIPGLPTSEVVRIVSFIGIFDLWCAAITIIGVWTVCKISERRWNPVTLVIGIACLLFGAFTNY